MIDITFYCIQPIEIDEHIYQELLITDYNLEKIKEYTHTDFNSLWLQEFSSKNRVYANFFSLKEKEKLSSELLRKDLHPFGGNIQIELSKFFIAQESRYELLFDLKMLFFFLSFEIHFKIPKEKVDLILKCQEENLYTYIRSLLVKENDEDKLAVWVDNVRRKSTELIVAFSNNVLNYKLENNYIRIKNNTGNITAIIYDKEFESRKEQWKCCNESAERLEVHSEPVYENEYVSYMFYGRFHTILLAREKEKQRYVPVQFHMQYMWFIIDFFNAMLDSLNIQVIERKNKKLEKVSDIIYEVINKVQLLNIHNERFSSAIEIDNTLIYKKIESKWNILINLQTLKDYILIFKDYLERLFSNKMAIVQRKQNKILFAISFLQIAALISVWNDYLSLLDESSIKNVDEILFLFFGEQENLVKFNEFIPLVLLLFTIVALIYLVIKKK